MVRTKRKEQLLLGISIKSLSRFLMFLFNADDIEEDSADFGFSQS